MANNVALLSDMSMVDNYIKNVYNIDMNKIQATYLPQSKSYLKISGIPYLIKGTNMPIDLSIVKMIIKSTHIFNNIHITFKPCVVKVSPKLDIVIVWLNI